MKHPPAEILEFIQQKAAYSGKSGISLTDIWLEVSRFLDEPFDDFLKGIVWQWLFFDDVYCSTDESRQLDVYKKDLDIPLPISANYEEFIRLNSNESEIYLRPSSDIQWKYLTGLENLKRLKSQLGEFPFQLLCEVAKAGSNGILAPDLSKITGQDPRSSTPRLKKLEELGLIVKKNYYNAKLRQHTSLCVHKNFAKEEFSNKVTNLNEGIETSRNIQKTKEHIVAAVKKAPNHLRGFSDLKVELKLNKNPSLAKFFGGIVEDLDKKGNVERLMVKESEDKPLVYCIKFLKDLPNDIGEMDELANFISSLDEKPTGMELEVNSEGIEADFVSEPVVNSSFPPQIQFFELILSYGTTGATSMDIVRKLTGISDCRPYTKVLDTFTSYVIDHDKLKKLRKYNEEYEACTIVRVYDYEGKYKFYRYFTKDNYLKISSTTKINLPPKKEVKKLKSSPGLDSLNKKHFSTIGTSPAASLSKEGPTNRSKRKITDCSVDENVPKVERRGRPRKHPKVAIEIDIESPRSQRTSRTKPRKELPSIDISDTPKELGSSGLEIDAFDTNNKTGTIDTLEFKQEDGFQISPSAPTKNSDRITTENNLNSLGDEPMDNPENDTVLNVDNQVKLLSQSAVSNTIENQNHSPKPKNSIKSSSNSYSSSLKAIKRRSALMEILKEQGGIAFTTAHLNRQVDEKLGNTTLTDKKTLARDISFLIVNKEIEAEDISFFRGGQAITRKLLIVLDPLLRPDQEVIERKKEECITENWNKLNSLTEKKLNERRVIEDQVTLFNETRPKRTNRLASLKSKTKPRENIKVEEDEFLNNSSTSTPVTKKSRKKVKNSTIEESKDNSDFTKDGSFTSLMSKKRRTRVSTKKKLKSTTSNIDSTSRVRSRGDNKFDQEQATTLYRAVIISRSFKRGPIDFESISILFKDMHINELKRKWIAVRKVAGGLSAVVRGIRVFERIITRAIDEGNITTADLLDFDIEFLLSIWEDADNSILEGIDSNPFYATIDANLEDYEEAEYKSSYPELFEQLEDNSMRQKEIILSGTTFYCDNYDLKELMIVPKRHDKLRSVLKATFSTIEENFTAQSVTNILTEYGEKEIQEAINDLLKDKEISYFSLEESDARFILTDKFNNALVQKVFSSKFFQQASKFESNFNDVVEANKGLILSQGITSGDVSSLLNLLASSNFMKISRIDKPYKFAGYESRLIDKSNLSCDIIVMGSLRNSQNSVSKIPVPTGKACSHIWLDLNGSINSKLWSKIIISTLYHIVFKPGISLFQLHRRLSTVLNVEDFTEIVKWLEMSHIVKKGPCDSLYALDKWNTILGH